MNNLPTPDTLSQSHSDRLKQQIAKEISQKGPIPFSRYMELALYAPGLGYYSAGARKFGEAGDFVTAPELSPLFSHCLARQCAQILKQIKTPSILEFGAGSGIMALEILKELERQQQLPHRYYILEVSADLRERQQTLFKEKAPQYLPRLEWLDQLPKNPIKGVILANEVLDAMPIHKFKIENGIKEFYVDYKNEQFVWEIKSPSDARLEKAIKQLDINLNEPYESEINLFLPAWIKSLSDSLEQGLVLLIDYGFPRYEYYHPDRTMGTIMCHYRHRAHEDPLILQGIQDITAHVDFTAIAEAAVDAGFTVEGFTHQAAFLLNCGISTAVETIDNELDHYNRAQQIKRLTLPSEMGELFKVIALTKGIEEELLGFAMMDQLARL